MEQQIEVDIERDNDIKLNFKFNEEIISLNLSSDKTSDTQEFFIKLLNILIKNPMQLNFKLNDDKTDLYHDVSIKYLENLETEVNKLITEIPKEE